MKTKKLTFSAVMIALSAAIMLSAYFPYLTYAIPCIAALPIMVIVIELGNKWGFFAYLASLLPIMLFCEPQAKLVYLLISGYYPVLKAIIERLNNLILELILKLLAFNAAFWGAVCVASFTIGFDFKLEGFESYGLIAFIAFWVLAQIVFVMFDFCITKMSVYYIFRLQKTVRKLLK